MNGHGDHANGAMSVIVEKVPVPTDFPYTGREGQVACSVGSKVYIFGGVQQGGQFDEPQETNEMLIFDMGNWLIDRDL